MFPGRVLMHKIYLSLNMLLFQGNVLISPQHFSLLSHGSPSGLSKAGKEAW